MNRKTLKLIAVLSALATINACGNQSESDKVHQSEKVPSQTEIHSSNGNVEAGKSVYVTCQACHGEKGEGNQDLFAPSLVNLESWYLERQLNNFRNGLRGYDPSDIHGQQMATIAKTLTEDDQVKDVVAYIETLSDIDPEISLKGNIDNGKSHYQMICGACHGPDARGNKALNAPGLAGLDDWYFKNQVEHFQNGLRGTHTEDIFGAQMQAISKSLPDEQSIDDVISYIQSLKQEKGS